MADEYITTMNLNVTSDEEGSEATFNSKGN